MKHLMRILYCLIPAILFAIPFTIFFDLWFGALIGGIIFMFGVEITEPKKERGEF